MLMCRFKPSVWFSAAELGDPANQLTLNSTGGAEDPFSKTALMISTGDAETVGQLFCLCFCKCLLDSNLPSGISINTYVKQTPKHPNNRSATSAAPSWGRGSRPRLPTSTSSPPMSRAFGETKPWLIYMKPRKQRSLISHRPYQPTNRDTATAPSPGSWTGATPSPGSSASASSRTRRRPRSTSAR